MTATTTEELAFGVESTPVTVRLVVAETAFDIVGRMATEDLISLSAAPTTTLGSVTTRVPDPVILRPPTPKTSLWSSTRVPPPVTVLSAVAETVEVCA